MYNFFFQFCLFTMWYFITFRGHNTSIYGHRQGRQETYIQPRGMMRPPIGRPNEKDTSVAMDTKDLHRLAKHLNHAII